MLIARVAALALLSQSFFFHATASHAAEWSQQDLAAAAALRDRAAAGTAAFEHVSSLITEVGPRFAGSAGDTAAVRWAMNRMGTLGFSNVHSQDVLVPRWVRGTAEAQLLGSTPRELVAVTMGGSIGTPEEGIEGVVTMVDSFDDLATLAPGSLANKILFINHRMERSRPGSGYGSAVRARVQGPSAAADLGAMALVIRSVGTSDDRIAHTGTLSYRLDAPRIPAFALSNPDADLLDRHLKMGKPVRLRLTSSARELPPAWSANVIGEIRGAQRPEEIVLLGAHLDSWDIGQGALDDGAGVAIVLEAARLIGKLERKPARTVRVVLFANEEFGLSGAKEYAKVLGEETSRHVLAMEADVGQGPVWRLRSQVPPEALPAIAGLHEALKPLNVELGPNDATGGADVGPLRELGIPVIDLSLDATNYFDVHHTINDTLAKIDPKILDQSVAAYAVAAYLAASKEGDFGRLVSAPKEETISQKTQVNKAAEE